MNDSGRNLVLQFWIKAFVLFNLNVNVVYIKLTLHEALFSNMGEQF